MFKSGQCCCCLPFWHLPLLGYHITMTSLTPQLCAHRLGRCFCTWLFLHRMPFLTLIVSRKEQDSNQESLGQWSPVVPPKPSSGHPIKIKEYGNCQPTKMKSWWSHPTEVMDQARIREPSKRPMANLKELQRSPAQIGESVGRTVIICAL